MKQQIFKVSSLTEIISLPEYVDDIMPWNEQENCDPHNC